MSNWRNKVEKLSTIYTNNHDCSMYQEINMINNAKSKILDEYEEKIEQLEETIKDKDLEIEDLKYEVNRLIDGHPSKEGYRMMSSINCRGI
jgi:Mg2+ and Co2+ transporter CorA